MFGYQTCHVMQNMLTKHQKRGQGLEIIEYEIQLGKDILESCTAYI